MRVISIPFVVFSSLYLAVVIMMSACAFADEGPGVDAQRAHIVQLMKELKLEPFLGKDSPLCREFLEDFRHQTNIKYIEPILQTDDYDDPKLRPYKEKCPNLELNKHMAYRPRDYEDAMKLPREERDAMASQISYGTRNFKLFRVDINNNSADGEEYIFYDEARRTVRPFDYKGKILAPEAGDYAVVDFTRCQFTGGAHVGDVYGKYPRTANVHGVIQYRQKYYIYAFEALSSGFGRLALNGYALAPTGEQKFGSICAY